MQPPQLAAGMVVCEAFVRGEEAHLWIVPVGSPGDHALARSCDALLAPDERERLASFPSLRRRHEFRVGRALLRHVLVSYAPPPPTGLRLSRDARGMLRLAEDDFPPLRFNLSHDDGVCVCAVAYDRAIGVDVASQARARDFALAARCFLSSVERRELLAFEPAQRAERFGTLWTLKEAYLKARGLGFTLPPELVCIGLDRQTPHLRAAPDDPAGRRFSLWTRQLTLRHRLSVAVEQRGEAEVSLRVRLGLSLRGSTPSERLLPRRAAST